jgi:zinc ribbon protein
MSNEGMKACANCGNEVREGARFCPSCGAPVVQAAAEPSRAEPPPPPSPGGKRRLRWVAVAAAVALLVAGGATAAVLAMTGGDGPNQVLPTGDETSTPAGASGVDCDELASFVDDFAQAQAIDGADLAASPESVEVITAALAALANQAPEDVRQDFETVSETWVEVARAVSDLGLEPGVTPDEEQVDAILELDGRLVDDPEFLDASANVADWLETAVAQCSSTDTETTESGDTTFGDETTTEAGEVGGEEVDETCAGFVAVATLARKENPPFAPPSSASRPNPSVDDVEGFAAIFAELASNAPAETLEDGTFHVGEPKQSLEATAQGLESYADLLSELGLEPGSDEALNEPRIEVVIDGLEEADSDLTSWFEDRCSEEDVAAFERIRNG